MAVSHLLPVGIFLGLWFAMSILCAPIFASKSCRRLLNAGPSNHAVVNYLAGMGVLTLVHVALIFGGGLLNSILGVQTPLWALTATLIAAGGSWIVTSFVLPYYGFWEPSGSGIDGRIILGLTAFWYVICTAILGVVFVFAWFLAFYPG